MRGWVMAGALALGLGACDAGRDRTPPDPDGGDNVTLTAGPGARAPQSMPDFAPLYPGARIESVMADGRSGGGGMVTFRADASGVEVADFYRRALDRSDLTDRTDVEMNGVLMITGDAADDPDRGLQVSIAPDAEDRGSVVTLVYSLGEG